MGGSLAGFVGELLVDISFAALTDGNEELVDCHGGVDGDFTAVEGFEGSHFHALRGARGGGEGG